MHRVDNFMPMVLQKTFTDGPTSGISCNLLPVRATGVLAVLRHYILRVLAVFRAFVKRILPVLQVFWGSILRVLLVLEVLYCSYSRYLQYLGRQYRSYSQYSQYLGRQYSVLSALGVQNVLDTPEYTRSMRYTGSALVQPC